jgi:oligosaccharide repeat unit polymerase
VVLWVCVAGIPLFLQRQIAAIGKGSLFLYRLRRYHLETQAEHLAQVNFLDNLVPLSLFVALLMVFEGSGTREGRFRRGAALVVALIYQVLTATRGSVVGFALMVGGIYLLKAKLAKLHHLVAVGSAALVLSMVLAFPLLKSGMEADESFLVNSARLTDDLVVYASGGLVAFGRVVSDPATIPPTRPVWAYFAFLLQKAGLTIATPALHASFVSIGPAHITNVYTMYFPYYCDFGYVGVLLFPVIFGCLATVCWGLARRGNPFGAVVFAGLIRAVVLSPYSEQLFLQLDWFIKNLLFTCVVYGVPFVLFTKSGQPEDTMSCE